MLLACQRTLASFRPAAAASRIISSGIFGVSSAPSSPPCDDADATAVARHEPRCGYDSRDALLVAAAAHAVLVVCSRATQPRPLARFALCWPARQRGAWRAWRRVVARGRTEAIVDMAGRCCGVCV